MKNLIRERALGKHIQTLEYNDTGNGNGPTNHQKSSNVVVVSVNDKRSKTMQTRREIAIDTAKAQGR